MTSYAFYSTVDADSTFVDVSFFNLINFFVWLCNDMTDKFKKPRVVDANFQNFFLNLPSRKMSQRTVFFSYDMPIEPKPKKRTSNEFPIKNNVKKRVFFSFVLSVIMK